MRSYPGSTGASPLRLPRGEGTVTNASGGLAVSTTGHPTEPPGTAPRFLPRPKAEVSTFKEI